MRRVIFVWAVRESGNPYHFLTLNASLTRAIADHLGWISRTLSEALSAAQSTSLVLEPTVYITGPTCAIPEIPRAASASSDGSSTPSVVGDSDKELPLYSSLKIVHGRPSIRRVLREGIDGSTGPVSVDGE